MLGRGGMAGLWKQEWEGCPGCAGKSQGLSSGRTFYQAAMWALVWRECMENSA